MKRIVVMAAAMFASSLAAHATTYDYTGADFASASAPYTTGDSVTGSLTTATPLGDNLINFTVTPASFSFSDGLQTINNMNAIGETFLVDTNASGNIVDWNIFIDGPTVYDNINVYGGSLDYAPGDSAEYGAGVIASNESSGAWTIAKASPSPVPEPSSLALLGTGVLGVIGVVRRRRLA